MRPFKLAGISSRRKQAALGGGGACVSRPARCAGRRARASTAMGLIQQRSAWPPPTLLYCPGPESTVHANEGERQAKPDEELYGRPDRDPVPRCVLRPRAPYTCILYDSVAASFFLSVSILNCCVT